MIIGLLFALFYLILFVASIIGIIYFIGKRREEKKKEKSILDREDY